MKSPPVNNDVHAVLLWLVRGQGSAREQYLIDRRRLKRQRIRFVRSVRHHCKQRDPQLLRYRDPYREDTQLREDCWRSE